MHHLQRLSQVNADIKALERYLHRSGLRQVLEEDVPGAPAESVAWMLGEPPRKWRLVHVAAGKRQILGEAPEQVRIRSMRALPGILRQAAKVATALSLEMDRAMEEAGLDGSGVQAAAIVDELGPWPSPALQKLVSEALDPLAERVTVFQLPPPPPGGETARDLAWRRQMVVDQLVRARFPRGGQR